jgi:hypothetical protein
MFVERDLEADLQLRDNVPPGGGTTPMAVYDDLVHLV